MGKIILHIGTPKTGSTALQDKLYDHESSLKKQDIIYPIEYISKGSGQVDFRTSLIKKDYPNKLEIRQYYSNLIDSLKPGQTLVLSAEQLWSVNPKSINDVYPSLKKHHINIVCYLRRQSTMIASHYKQKIKGGVEVGSIEQFFTQYNSDYDYNYKLSEWASTFKKAHFYPVVYESIKQYGVVASFQDLLSEICNREVRYLIDNIANTDYPRSNVSLPDSIIRIIESINQSSLPSNYKSDLRSAVIYNSDNIALKVNVDMPIMNSELSQKIDEHYKESNFELLKNFSVKGVDEPTFLSKY